DLYFKDHDITAVFIRISRNGKRCVNNEEQIQLRADIIIVIVGYLILISTIAINRKTNSINLKIVYGDNDN
ncbi:12985_t:CDS:1, partial [Racocetra persica]